MELKLEYKYNELKPLSTNKLRNRCSSHKLCGSGSRKDKECYIKHLLIRTQYIEQPQLTTDWEKIKCSNIVNRRTLLSKYDPSHPLIINNNSDDRYYRFVCNQCRSQFESKIIIESTFVYKVHHKTYSGCICPLRSTRVDIKEVTMIKYADWTWPNSTISMQTLERIKASGSIKIVVRGIKKRKASGREPLQPPPSRRAKITAKPSIPRIETEPLSDNDDDESDDGKNNDDNTNNPNKDAESNYIDDGNFKFHELNVYEEIGSGTSGCIYKCDHSVTKQMVAVKVMKQYKKMSKNDRTDDPALREAQIMQQFKTNAVSNIIQIIGCVVMKGVVHIAMEYMDCDLAHFLSKIDAEQLHDANKKLVAKKVSGHIIPAMDSMHHKGLGHGDIKPQNILINFHSNTIKLGDLGSVISKQAFEGFAEIRYSPGYYPQIDDIDIKQRLKYDVTKMDIYCFGMTMMDILMPKMSPKTFMKSIDNTNEYAVFTIEALQQRAYKYTQMAEYQNKYGAVMKVLSECLTPSYQNRSRVNKLLEMDYIKEAIANSGKLQLPPLSASASTPKPSKSSPPTGYPIFFKW